MSTSEALGRLMNVVPIASGVAVSLRDCAGITFVCTGADTFTLTASTTFGGSYASPGNFIDHYYQAAATNGTAAWTRQTQAKSNAVTQGSAYTTVIEVLTAQVEQGTPGDIYVKLTASAGGLVSAYTHDLSYQRKPANLPIMSA
jgi:hypothetical protein